MSTLSTSGLLVNDYFELLMYKDSFLLFSLFYLIISIKEVYNSNLRTCVSKRTRARIIISTSPNLFQTVILKTVRQASNSVFAIVKSMVLLLQSAKIVTFFFWKMFINLMAFVCIFFFWLTDVKCSSVHKVFLNIHAVWA